MTDFSQAGVHETTAVIDNGNFGKRSIRFETGRLARQAAGSVVAYLDEETMLLSATTASKNPKEHFDFFPLTVDVEERMYAAGRIPGSFFRREGRPSTDAILTCRLIDRPLRPSFVDGLRNEIQVVITVQSLNPQDPYDVLAINAASASTQLAGLPFSGPVGATRVALVGEQWVAFPTHEQLAKASFDMVVAGRVVGAGDNADVAGSDHAAGDHHVEGGLLQLLVGGERHPLVTDQRDAHAADRAGERQARELRRRGRGVDRHDVVQVLRVQAHHRDDDLDLVAQALGEGRAQRPVDQTAGEDRVLGRTPLAAEERAGDAPGRVHPLLDVHGQREEVQVVLGLLGRGGRGEHHRVVVEVGDGGAGGLPGQPARLEADGAGAERAVVDHGFGALRTVDAHGFSHGKPPQGSMSVLAAVSRWLVTLPVFDRSTRIERPADAAERIRKPLPRTGPHQRCPRGLSAVVRPGPAWARRP